MINIDDIITYVNKVEPSETVDLVKQSCQLFEEYNHWIYMAQLDDTISSAEFMGLADTEIVQAILNRLSQIATELLALLGFGVQEGCLLSDRIELLGGLKAITSLENSETVFRLIEGDASDQDILAELIGETTMIDKENVLPMVTRVPVLFRQMLAQAYGEEELEEETNVADVSKIAEIFAKFKQSDDGQEPTYAQILAQYSSGYGITLETLFNLFNQSCAIDTQANTDSYRNVARELYALCCISRDYHSKPLEGCRLLSVKMYPDLLMRANFEKEVRQILLKQAS